MIVGYLSVAQVLALHDEQLRRYGGATGLRDRGGLEAALARPAMTFDGEDLYEDMASKASALMHSLVLNHPFIDGNGRTARAISNHAKKRTIRRDFQVSHHRHPSP